MQLNFDDIDVAINRTGILSYNASLNTTNSIEAAYVLGYAKSVNQLPRGGINTSFNMSYYPVIHAEPNLAVVNKIKILLNDNNYVGEKVEFGGITHNYCFLNSYNLKISPNNIVEANVSYVTFWDLCGELRNKSNLTEYFNSGDVCHSWSTYLNDDSSIKDVPIYELSYDFKANWNPVYKIGSKYPSQVKLMNGSESLSFNIDQYRRVLFTGENVYTNLLNKTDGNVYLKNVSLLCQNNCDGYTHDTSNLSLPINDFKIKSVGVNGQVGEFIRTTYQSNRYF